MQRVGYQLREKETNKLNLTSANLQARLAVLMRESKNRLNLTSANFQARTVQAKKRKQSLGEFPGKVCRACEGYHLTRRCYYLFQDMAPKKWTPQPLLQKLVEQKLKDDPTLEEEAKRWTKS